MVVFGEGDRCVLELCSLLAACWLTGLHGVKNHISILRKRLKVISRNTFSLSRSLILYCYGVRGKYGFYAPTWFICVAQLSDSEGRMLMDSEQNFLTRCQVQGGYSALSVSADQILGLGFTRDNQRFTQHSCVIFLPVSRIRSGLCSQLLRILRTAHYEVCLGKRVTTKMKNKKGNSDFCGSALG